MPIGGLSGSFAECLQEVQETFAQLRVRDPVIGADQFHGLALGKQVRFEHRRRCLAQAPGPPLAATRRCRRKILEEKGNRHVQHTAQVEQPGSADAVDAALVFLDLLVGNAKCLEAGDLDGKAVWLRVIRAIEELQDRGPPAAGQPWH